MACKYCEFKGYITSTFFANNKENTSIEMCPKCKDIDAYSKYIKKMYSSSNEITPPLTLISSPEDKIIDFLEYKKKKGKPQ